MRCNPTITFDRDRRTERASASAELPSSRRPVSKNRLHWSDATSGAEPAEHLAQTADLAWIGIQERKMIGALSTREIPGVSRKTEPPTRHVSMPQGKITSNTCG